MKSPSGSGRGTIVTVFNDLGERYFSSALVGLTAIKGIAREILTLINKSARLRKIIS